MRVSSAASILRVREYTWQSKGSVQDGVENRLESMSMAAICRVIITQYVATQLEATRYFVKNGMISSWWPEQPHFSPAKTRP